MLRWLAAGLLAAGAATAAAQDRAAPDGGASRPEILPPEGEGGAKRRKGDVEAHAI